jgi:hypothetical protein
MCFCTLISDDCLIGDFEVLCRAGDLLTMCFDVGSDCFLFLRFLADGSFFRT